MDPIELFAQHYMISDSLQSPPVRNFARTKQDAINDSVRESESDSRSDDSGKQLGRGSIAQSKERHRLEPNCFDPDSDSDGEDGEVDPDSDSDDCREDAGGASVCSSCGKWHARLPSAELRQWRARPSGGKSAGDRDYRKLAWYKSLRGVWNGRQAILSRLCTLLAEQSAEYRESPKKFPDLPAQFLELVAKTANQDAHDPLKNISTHGSYRPFYGALKGETNERITRDLDVPADMYGAVQEGEFWRQLLEVCLHDQPIHLPIQGRKVDAPLIQQRDELIVLETSTNHQLAVLIGNENWEWMNRTTLTTGFCQRLHGIIIRVEDRLDPAFFKFFNGHHRVVSPHYEQQTDCDVSNDQNEYRVIPGVVLAFVADPYSPHSQHPTDTVFRDRREENGCFVHLTGHARPGSHISGLPIVSASGNHVLGPRFLEEYRIQSVRPLHEIIEGGNLVLEIVSARLCVDLYDILRYCRDSGYPPSCDDRFFRNVFGVLEQVLNKGKYSFLFSQFFMKDWVTIKHSQDGSVAAVFLFPSDEFRAGITASVEIRPSQNRPYHVLEVRTTLIEVGNRRPYYQHNWEQCPVLNNMIGLAQISDCREAFKRIFTGESDKEVVNTTPDKAWLDNLSQVHLFERLMQDGKSSKNDCCDMSNLGPILEIIASGSIPEQRDFDPVCRAQSHRNEMLNHHEISQIVVFNFYNHSKNQIGGGSWMEPIATVTASRTIGETDENGETRLGRRKHTVTSTPKAIHMTITVERNELRSWPPRNTNDHSTKEVARIKIEDYALHNGIFMVGCSQSCIDAFIKGGSIDLDLKDQWERVFYMERVVEARRQVQKFIDWLCILTGHKPPIHFPLAYQSHPKKMSGGSFISGENEVRDKYILCMIEERPDRRRDVANLMLRIVVSLNDDEDGDIASNTTAVLKEAQVRDIMILLLAQSSAFVMQSL